MAPAKQTAHNSTSSSGKTLRKQLTTRAVHESAPSPGRVEKHHPYRTGPVAFHETRYYQKSTDNTIN